MFPSPFHILIAHIYGTHRCNAVSALQNLANGLKHMETCPHHDEASRELQKLCYEEMKLMATEDMKVQGKWN